jgi:hypothetical protein
MPIKLLAFHNQLIADLASDHQQHDLGAFHIIEHAKIADAKFKLDRRVRPQPLDSTRRLVGRS